MKHKIPMLAALLLTAPLAHGFTLGFAANLGATLPPNLTVNVPGYGDVMFSSTVGSTLAIDDATYGLPAINFDTADAVIITFLGADPSNVEFGFSGVSVGESFIPIQLTNTQFVLSLQGTTNGAGLNSVSWTAGAVPEPSAALLGGIGVLALFRRRR